MKVARGEPLPRRDLVFDIGTVRGRARLRLWAETVPRLIPRPDMQDPLTDDWRRIVIDLIDALDRAQGGES